MRETLFGPLIRIRPPPSRAKGKSRASDGRKSGASLRRGVTTGRLFLPCACCFSGQSLNEATKTETRQAEGPTYWMPRSCVGATANPPVVKCLSGVGAPLPNIADKIVKTESVRLLVGLPNPVLRVGPSRSGEPRGRTAPAPASDCESPQAERHSMNRGNRPPRPLQNSLASSQLTWTIGWSSYAQFRFQRGGGGIR